MLVTTINTGYSVYACIIDDTHDMYHKVISHRDAANSLRTDAYELQEKARRITARANLMLRAADFLDREKARTP